jgi:hypothetical protein
MNVDLRIKEVLEKRKVIVYQIIDLSRALDEDEITKGNL